MDIAIAGSHGLIGTALRRSLEADGHRVVPIIRSRSADSAGERAAGERVVRYDPATATVQGGSLEGVDAIVNLAGAPIGGGLLTAKRKQELRDSRVRITRALSEAVRRLDDKPRVVVSGSAIGIYGSHRGDEQLTEASTTGDDFLAGLCREWEAQALAVADIGIRVACLRTGLVLAADGGLLKPQVRIFKLGLGGPAGTGEQWQSWIHLADEIAAVRYLLDHELEGPVNLVAPNPVTNATFASTLARVLHRPARLRIPKLLARAPAPIGDVFDELLFASQRAAPAKLTDAGFTFGFTDLEAALRELLQR